jgi:hypothetical protein
VEALKALKPEWDAITKRVQDKMFAGLAAEITELAGVYFPVLDTGLQNASPPGSTPSSCRPAKG